MSLYIYLLLFIISLTLSITINYNKAGKFKEELKLIWGDKCFHIHHWITYSIFIVLILLGTTKNKILIYSIITILFAIICEDFLYRNILKIREKC
jgi:hypothetical protein